MAKPKPAPVETPVIEDGAVSAARPSVSERGEIALVLDGGTNMVLRPSYEAIVAFEAATGKGLLDLARDALAGRLTLSDTAQVVTECVKAWGRSTGDRGMAAVGAPRIAELIMEGPGGFRDTLSTVAGVLAMATTGAYTASGEKKPMTVTTTV